MAKTTNFKVNVSPEMQLYKVLQKLSYGEETALCEFVDNSVQAFIDKKNAIKVVDGKDPKLVVVIDIDTSTKTMSISDNASGINRKDFQRAIRMGHHSVSPHSKSSMSVYGIGMKSASVWFSNDWTIETSCVSSEEKLVLDFRLDDLLASGSSNLEVVSEKEERNQHYTKIILKKHIREQSKDFYRDRVLPHLLETFNKFGDFLEIKLIHDDERLYPTPQKVFLDMPKVLNAPEVDKKGKPKNKNFIEWKKDLSFDYKGKKVNGFVMIREMGAYHQPGIRLYKNKRVIEGTSLHKSRPIALFGTSNKYASQRVYGELHLNDFDVNFMKTGFDDNLIGFYDKLKEILSPPENDHDLFAQATNFRKKKFEAFLELQDEDNSGDSNTEKGDEESDTAQEDDNTSATSSGQSEQGDVGPQGNENNDNQSNQGPRTKIQKSNSIEKKLSQLGNSKLVNLYRSLCVVSLVEHPILLYVGAWSFLESLSTAINKNDGNDFYSFLNSKINLWYKDRGEKNDFKGAIKDIHEKGNCNKHSGQRFVVDARQLENDFKVIKPLLLKIIDEAINLNSKDDLP